MNVPRKVPRVIEMREKVTPTAAERRGARSGWTMYRANKGPRKSVDAPMRPKRPMATVS